MRESKPLSPRRTKPTQDLVVDVARYPYAPALLAKHDAFELWPLDGGAFFFLNQHIGCATGDACQTALQDGTLLQPWTRRDGTIDWDRAWDETAGGPLGRPIEKHVWINRLYFLLPLALAFHRSRDVAFARQWKRYLDSWVAAHPQPREMSLPAMATKYVWFDMQVAWRLSVLVHSVRLLDGSGLFPGPFGRRVREMIAHHAAILCHETAGTLTLPPKKPAIGNHFLHKATVLLYAGVLLPECVEAEQCITLGAQAIERHLAHDMLSDGGDVERSPSYSHFMGRLYVDASRLLQTAGHRQPRGLAGAIRRQYDFLWSTAGPDGRSLQINDSYALDVAADRAVVASLVRLPRPPARRSRWFKPTAWATLHAGHFSVLLDAEPTTQYHHHDGKPNLVVFADGEPLLIDAGCCDYDDAAWMKWYRSAAAHNTIRIGRGALKRIQWFDRPGAIRIVSAGATEVICDTVWREAAFSCTWRRRIAVVGTRLRVDDRITASVPIVARLQFIAATFAARITRADRAAGEFSQRKQPCIDRQNHSAVATQYTRDQRGRRLRFVTVIE
jgi:hypothetical protein